MLRVLIAMAHADAAIRPQEKQFIENLMKHLPLDHNQKTIITRDLEKPGHIDELMPHITEPKFRAQIVDFAHVLAARDGKTMPSEEYLLTKIRAEVLEGVDMDALRAEIRERVKNEMIRLDDRPETGSFLSRFVERILRGEG